jgi:UDP-3-O-[3-hydroxymyristoyl] glucosamine N-acyltransferase
MLFAQSGVPASLEGGKAYFGSPAVEAGEKKRELVWIKRIPEIWKKINSSTA